MSSSTPTQTVALREPLPHTSHDPGHVSHRMTPQPNPGPRLFLGTPVAAFKAFGAAILVPLFLAVGMSLAYLGAFHQPTPHHLPVAIVGSQPATQVFAQTLNDKAPSQLSVRTVATDAEARKLIVDRTISAAYEPTTTSASLLVSSAASDTSATVVQKIFLPIAYAEKLPLQVVDVVPAGTHDSTGQGIFFLLVGLSVGSYATAAAVAAFASRLGIRWSIVTSVVMSGIVAGIALTVAGPIYHVIDGQVGSIWLLGWLYSLAIILIGVGLHPLLRHWTTAALTALFVMLNFTSSGGIFAPALMPGFFAGLHTFWNGAAWLDAAQTLQYFPGHGFGLDVLRLGLWAAAGLGLTLLTHLLSRRRVRLANEAVATREEETVIAA
ncbi:hypothetical protein AX769_19945 [Frondihabitans sp. PAMC 28766]|uniref:hypothetical protein n=1 Tax=Frondihabitans sp. PAMC 28766 TaxID=1795630 RepID=UPI00078B2AA8|nr:hypothetical protein [Frondihabitans sp. PAMC 28766]AMM22003.1 hypothetical protein AX769_19945 [Frondihabitans sp. PAMC 28766]